MHRIVLRKNESGKKRGWKTDSECRKSFIWDSNKSICFSSILSWRSLKAFVTKRKETNHTTAEMHEVCARAACEHWRTKTKERKHPEGREGRGGHDDIRGVSVQCTRTNNERWKVSRNKQSTRKNQGSPQEHRGNTWTAVSASSARGCRCSPQPVLGPRIPLATSPPEPLLSSSLAMDSQACLLSKTLIGCPLCTYGPLDQ